MIDVSELITDPDFVQPQPVTVQRATGSWDGSGIYSPTPFNVLYLVMIIEQMTPSQVLAMPEGERDHEYITCWSNAPLLASDGITDQQCDVILWKNKPWRVIRCADRSDNGFWEAVATFSPNTGGTVTS